MRLYKHEAKQLFAAKGIPVPGGTLVTKPEEVSVAGVVKAEVMAAGRGKAGAVKICRTVEDARAAVGELIGKTVLGEVVECVTVEQALEKKAEHYVAITFDTRERKPVLILSLMGGMEIEELAKKHPDKIVKLHVDPRAGLEAWQAREAAVAAGFRGAQINQMADIACRLYRAFREYDARLVEINPVIHTADDKLVAADAVLILDEDALFRHDYKFPPRKRLGRPPTERELEAKKIDEAAPDNPKYYQGVAGKYLELDGDIAMMTAGGGASLTNMDALVAYGGRPANFTEYGGNPPAEKVFRLAKLMLSKPGLHGCWHVGGTANNTRIDETMRGFSDAVRELRVRFPIVVRRDGPGREEGFAHLQKLKDEGFDIEFYDRNTPMTKTAKMIGEKAKKFAADLGAGRAR
jgi:succinyl-CoA synthetase beta subunit